MFPEYFKTFRKVSKRAMINYNQQILQREPYAWEDDKDKENGSLMGLGLPKPEFCCAFISVTFCSESVLLFKPQECRSLGHVQGPVDRRRKSGTL